MYRLELTAGAQRDLEQVPQADFARLATTIQSLRDTPRPRGALKLRGPIHRIRVGHWRVIYAVFDGDQLVLVGKVARRRENTYDNIERLF